VLLKSSSTGAEIDQAVVSIPILVCPSDRPEGRAPLNYVVNCGPVAVAGQDDIFRTLVLFKDRRAILTADNKKVKIEEIPDGASNTILLSENVDAGNAVVMEWYDGNHVNQWDPTIYPPDELLINSVPNTDTRSNHVVRKLGFLWSPDSDYAPNSSVPGPRPSSKHPGTFVVAYADGSAKPINDDIAIEDWLKAVCPDDEKLGGL
jgi:hypothetical protein